MRLIHALVIGSLLSIPGLPGKSAALTLQEGLKFITSNGRDVAIARSDEESARGTLSLARSPWLPQVDLYGRETWLRYQPAAKTPFGAMFTAQDQFTTYGFRVTQLLYDFGRTSSSISSARHGLLAREINTNRTRNRAALEFVVTYLDLLEADQLSRVADEEVMRYSAHKKDTESRFKAGVATRNEVLQTEVVLADSRQRQMTAQNYRTLKASRINSLLMRPLNDPVQASELIGSPLAGTTLEAAWSAAEAENPDLRDLDERIRAKEEQVRSIEAEYLPTVYVSGGYELSENRYLVHDDNWSVIAGMNLNLFAGGATSAKTRVAKSELASLRLSREKLLDAIRLDVQAAYLDLQSTSQKVEVAMTALTQAEENLRLQKLRYQAGVATATEVLDAVTLVTVAETNLWRSSFGRKRAEAGMLHAMGKDLVTAYAK